MKDQKEIDQLRAEYVEYKMATMRDDGDGTELIFYAEKGLEDECKDLTFEDLNELMAELVELNGDNEDEEEKEYE
jgi:hypothetical protein